MSIECCVNILMALNESKVQNNFETSLVIFTSMPNSMQLLLATA